jgi:hypothetical protein
MPPENYVRSHQPSQLAWGGQRLMANSIAAFNITDFAVIVQGSRVGQFAEHACNNK